MIARGLSAGLVGIGGIPVNVETDLSRGLPGCTLVGLAEASVREALPRIRAAIKNSGYEYPVCRMTVNLAPANTRKDGSHFDLPIAMGILSASGQITGLPPDISFLGELSLNGTLNPMRGALPLALALKEAGAKKVILPMANAEEAGMAQGIEIWPAQSLAEVVAILMEPHRQNKVPCKTSFRESGHKVSLDYGEINGQDQGKRAMVIAASGGHGVLMTGSPGSGKTMLAECLPSILPPLTYEECMQVTRIHSVAGLLGEGMPVVRDRPFRNPHHSITRAALLGGGFYPVPGEFSLAHLGVLFLDEIQLFDFRTLEALRQPLESKEVRVNRRGGTVCFPGDPIVVAAGNPCKCGFAGDPSHPCTCTQGQIAAWQAKLSGPVLDRLDIHLNVTRPAYPEASFSREGMSSEIMASMVAEARNIQHQRTSDGMLNGRISNGELKQYCHLGSAEHQFMEEAYHGFGLTMRSVTKVLRIARTIADLSGDVDIRLTHLAEALQYREPGGVAPCLD